MKIDSLYWGCLIVFLILLLYDGGFPLLLYENNYFFSYYSNIITHIHLCEDATGGLLTYTYFMDTPHPPGEGALNGVRKKPGFSGINESSACSKNPPGIRFIISIQGVFRGFLGGLGVYYWIC